MRVATAPCETHGMKILLINWQDRENPLAGGAEIHLHEIFGRLAARGHEVVLLCGGWPGCSPDARLDGIEVHRVGTRATFPFLARRAFGRVFRERRFDLLVEDINKVPLYTTHWGGPPVVGLLIALGAGAALMGPAALWAVTVVPVIFAWTCCPSVN